MLESAREHESIGLCRETSFCIGIAIISSLIMTQLRVSISVSLPMQLVVLAMVAYFALVGSLARGLSFFSGSRTHEVPRCSS